MKEPLITIAITPGDIQSSEPALIKAALDAGFTYVHLRHPAASLRDMRNLIEAVPAKLHPRLKLHGHFDLLHSFNLGGVHLNHRCPQAPAGYIGHISRSCHSPEQVLESQGMEYVTLSPIFDSISKRDYHAAFSDEILLQLNTVSPVPVVALGGVTPARIPHILQLRFAGYAVLGALGDFLNK